MANESEGLLFPLGRGNVYASIKSYRRQSCVHIAHYKKPTDVKGGRVQPTLRAVTLNGKEFDRLFQLRHDLEKERASRDSARSSLSSAHQQQQQQQQQPEPEQPRRRPTQKGKGKASPPPPPPSTLPADLTNSYAVTSPIYPPPPVSTTVDLRRPEHLASSGQRFDLCHPTNSHFCGHCVVAADIPIHHCNPRQQPLPNYSSHASSNGSYYQQGGEVWDAELKSVASDIPEDLMTMKLEQE